ncbi:expressed unknown protein [Ectocarpus siliculosus]|uniref:Uncharacterized protein n=1 Tax=Ectocarpus siliculosus TaxID=2880 RepID=D7G2S9_ECTSI|nr:expressed unknown protein [Ectocarpus siliculosus]|eukprot:CBJ33433.1 expressed unknown protein [Ectocarpus siliculosus]
MMAVCSFGLRLPLDLSRPFHQVSPVCVRVEHRTSCRETSVRVPQGLMNGARPWRAATRLAQLVLVWSGSEPEPALSILKDCVSLLEKEFAFSAPAFPAVPLLPTMPGPSRSSCLNALVIALNETCNGESWYTSTKELQLASLEFCVACRNYQTLHLKVDAQIPRRLLARADAPPPHPELLCRTRVPRLRARRVTWGMRKAAELSIPIFAMTDVDCLKFGETSLEALRLWHGRDGWKRSSFSFLHYSTSRSVWSSGQHLCRRLNSVAVVIARAYDWICDRCRRKRDNDVLVLRPTHRQPWLAYVFASTPLGDDFKQSLQGLGTWMPNLEVLRLFDFRDPDFGNDSLLLGIGWPTGLRQLAVYECTKMDGVTIPSTVEVLYKVVQTCSFDGARSSGYCSTFD